MSWSRRVMAGLALVALTACGFEPLYQKGGGASSDVLASVRVQLIEDREGQQLRNRLLELLSPRGMAAAPVWSLDVTLSETIEELLVAESSFASRANLRITASYRLSRLGQSLAVSGDNGSSDSFSATSRSISSFNVLDAQFEYANVVAERDAREKALRLLANEITRQVGLWLREAAGDGDG